MQLFLTSNIGGSYMENETRIPCVLDGSNHFLDNLKKCWVTDARCLILSSSPDDDAINDSFQKIFTQAFQISNISFSRMDICDKRNESKLKSMIEDYDVLILAGGHVPTQNQFFHRIHLQELIKSYQGIVIGISAGTMNCAETVYAPPELEGEAINPNYQRYLKGLDLTKISILPHFQDMKDMSVDGLRALEDILLPDSKVRPFYALADGSYILVEEGKSLLYGEAYLVKDGIVTKICEKDKSLELNL